MYETKQYFYGTGRRKHSVARVRVYNGTGKITINDRDIDDYFGLETLKLIVRSPLALTDTDGQVRHRRSTLSAAVLPARLALSATACPALCCSSTPSYRTTLKKAGFLTRDPRMKERKKYGLKAARRAPQFSKR